MSDVSVAAVKALHRAQAWLSKEHPGDSEAQAIRAEVEESLAGLRAAAKDLPALLADGAALSIDVARLSATVLARTVDLSAVISAGKDTLKAWADLQAAYADFAKARADQKASDEAVKKLQTPQLPSVP